MVRILFRGGQVLGWSILLIGASFVFATQPGYPVKMLGIVIASAGGALILVSSQLLNQVKASKFDISSSLGKYALFLRSFEKDDQILSFEKHMENFFPFLPSKSVEQVFVGKLKRKVAPVIAVGIPNEKLPPLGALRLYFDDNEWQKNVLELIQGSLITILRPGQTDAILWECRQVVDFLHPKKFGLWMPDELKYSEYRIFRENCIGIFPHPLPSYRREIEYILFDENWEAHCIEIPRIGRGRYSRPKLDSRQQDQQIREIIARAKSTGDRL